MATLLGTPKFQAFETGTSAFLSGGKVYSYIAGTTTPLATYPTVADAQAGTNANTNPVILDSRGEANIVLQGSTKLILTDSTGSEVWSVDNVGIAAGTVSILDSYGNELVKFVEAVSAVNELTITNAATGTAPQIAATGSDTNVDAKITSKGSGTLKLDGGSTGTVDIGTTSTGAINLKRSTNVTGTMAVTGAATVSTTLDITGNTTLKTSNGGLNVMPAGCVMWYAGTSVPTGWLECAGAAVSRTTYSSLFTAIGTTYGTGDGTTTFNLPTSARVTLVGRGGTGTATLANTVGSTGGAETHTLTTTEMPAHTHGSSAGASSSVKSYTAGGSADAAGAGSVTGSNGSGGAHNNMQPSLVMMMIIKL